MKIVFSFAATLLILYVLSYLVLVEPKVMNIESSACYSYSVIAADFPDWCDGFRAIYGPLHAFDRQVRTGTWADVETYTD
jgi:hypothetical protein